MDYAKRYANRFAVLYDEIVSGELSGDELLQVQYKIYQTVEETRRLFEEKEDRGCNYRTIEKSFRWLVDVIIEIYFFKRDVLQLNVILDTRNKNDNYNSELIQRYFNEAASLLELYPDRLYVICDLAEGNIKVGDLLEKNEEICRIMEVKRPTSKILEILDIIDNDKDYIGKTKYDIDQIERIKKQFQKNEKASEQLSSVIKHNDYGYFLPISLDFPRYYSHVFDAITYAKNGLCRKVEVDDCISIFTLDVIGYNLSREGKEQEFIKYSENYREKDLLETMNNITTIMQSEIDGASFIDYNKDMLVPFLPKIYHTGLSGEQVAELLLGNINLYIQFDIEKFFDRLRSLGYKVYPQKGNREPSCVIYKGKRWIIAYNGKVLGPLQQGVLNRVFYAFYTTSSVVKFFDEILMVPLKHDVKRH